MTTVNIPDGWTDETEIFFEEDEGGVAMSNSSKSRKFVQGIVTRIRSRYQGDYADLDEKFVDFKKGWFYLEIQSPRGFSGEALKLRGIRDNIGEKHFSPDLEKLIAIAEEAINQAS